MKLNKFFSLLFAFIFLSSTSYADAVIVDHGSSSLLTRITKLEHQLQYLIEQNYGRQLADNQKELAELRGKNSELIQKIEQLTQRLNEIANRTNEAAKLKPKTEQTEATTEAAETKLYQTALDLLVKAPNKSQQKLQEYLKKYPKGMYRAKARYWLGESYFAQQKYQAAIEEWQFFVRQFPRNNLIPEVLLKLAVIQLKLKHPTQAKNLLTRLIKEYPKTKAAQLARTQLEQLK